MKCFILIIIGFIVGAFIAEIVKPKTEYEESSYAIKRIFLPHSIETEGLYKHGVEDFMTLENNTTVNYRITYNLLDSSLIVDIWGDYKIKINP